MHSPYYDPDALKKAAATGAHRDAIGGLWEEMGELQLAFLHARGLLPHHKLLDIGCGALRLGVKAIPYLQPGHYFGSDLSVELLDVGYTNELTPDLRARLPRANLSVSGDFDFSFLPAPVDFAIAQSVFTHLPLNHLRRCLAKLHPHVERDGFFYVTFFECPSTANISLPREHSGTLKLSPPVTTYDTRDPYHYYAADLIYAARGLPWQAEIIGDWNHPRGQRMAAFKKAS